MSSARLFLVQPKRNRWVLRLYKCIGTQRLGSTDRKLWSMEQAASQASIAPGSCELKRAPPAWIVLEGQGRPQGVIGHEGGELHHSGTHWRSLLIQRKRSSTRKECTHYTKVVRC